MEVLRKMFFSSTVYAIISILLLPFVSSSVEQAEATGNSTVNNSNIQKLMSPKLMFEITVHGFLLWTSMGFLMPIGILIIRLSKRKECGSRLIIIFYAHAISQTLAVLLVTTGAVLSFRNFNNSFSNHHQKLGVVLYGIIWLQAMIGFFRPQMGRKGRSVWFMAHWLLGTVVTLLGVVNIYTGLEAFHEKTSKSIHLWTVFFTVEISVIVFIYLFQDKWTYIQKQGVVLGNEPISPTEKELSTVGKKGSTTDQTC